MLFFLIPFIYFMVGTIIARHLYAVEAHALGSREVIEAAKIALDNLAHGFDCYQKKGGLYYSRNKACDCSKKQQWRELRDKTVGNATPVSPYSTVFFWPLVGYHKFLTSGTVKKRGVDHFEIERMERELEIGK